jgi:hypothetical protein
VLGMRHGGVMAVGLWFFGLFSLLGLKGSVRRYRTPMGWIVLIDRPVLFPMSAWLTGWFMAGMAGFCRGVQQVWSRVR